MMMASNNEDIKDGIKFKKYNFFDKRFDCFFATAIYSQVIGSIINEFCDSIILKTIVIPLFLVALFSVLYSFYLNNYLETIRRKIQNVSKGEVVAAIFDNVEFYLITFSLIVYDIKSMFDIIFLFLKG